MLRSPLQQRALQLTRGMRPASSVLTALRFGCKLENGQRIYTSNLPSIMSIVNQERSLYEFTLRHVKEAAQDKPALIQMETGEEVTYAQLQVWIERVASLLYHEGGIRKGDTVTVALTNSIFFTPVVYGILRLGARVSTVNPVADPESLAYHVTEAKSTVLLGTKFYQKNAESAADRVMRASRRVVKVFFPEEFIRDAAFTPVDASYDGLTGSALNDTVFIPFSFRHHRTAQRGPANEPKHHCQHDPVDQDCWSDGTRQGHLRPPVFPHFRVYRQPQCVSGPRWYTDRYGQIHRGCFCGLH
ncbi:AMP-binding enzyme, putative [Angomonas deanei]|uniref:AMP-binding enzyme, putative n=1 Tax=Angomonas deanei TaxID=59799 RepID=A0A7G2CCN3_9TRYP|nr:AMP-binding enzyme, putative [Angomonas deanei]